MATNLQCVRENRDAHMRKLSESELCHSFIVSKRQETRHMKRYTELLYWHKYGEYFHGDFNDRDTIAIDEGCPERAIKSFWAWFEQKDI